MTTEYEDLLAHIIEEKNAKLAELRGKKGKTKEISSLESDIAFLKVELGRYEQGMALFRSRTLPKVGRWGKPETDEPPTEHSGEEK